MTQLESARKGIITAEMEKAASYEPISAEEMRDRIAKGLIVIPCNKNHEFLPVAVGNGTYIKVNANIGISSRDSSLDDELLKLRTAVHYGAHSVMDLSTCADIEYLREIRRGIIAGSPIMVGTVPVYESSCSVIFNGKEITSLETSDFLDVIKRQAEDGVDFITVHAGVTRQVMDALHADSRIGGIVSRGGSLMAEWMKFNNSENPYFSRFDDILDICLEYDVTMSLGDGLRPGAINDGTDRAQIQELIVLGELVDRCRDRGVQVMVEGPGHVQLSDVEANVKLQKRLCRDAPFYILGPIVTDIAPGYDHITSAIGGTVAGMAGADFLCYVTPAEHLHLPDAGDVREGIIAARIAAHAADVAAGKGDAKKRDEAMSKARFKMDWNSMAELALDGDKVRENIKHYDLDSDKECTMCGEFCSLKRDYSDK
jgi:phosphomethylpyrimidine synthase